MTAVFVRVPHQHVGEPVSMADAIRDFTLFAEAPGYDVLLTSNGRHSPPQGAWAWVLSGLMTGAFHAFVQCPEKYTFVRIPVEYWIDYPFFDGPPVLFEGMAGSVGCSSSMIGQPVLLWNGSWNVDPSPFYDVARVLREMITDPKKISDRSLGTLLSRRADTANFDRHSSWEALSEWYLKRIKDAQNGGYSRDQDTSAGKLVGISRDKVRDLRKTHAPDEWSKDGRKSVLN